VLTDREVEVLRLIGRGSSNVEIAEALWVAESTVKTRVTRVFGKLRLRDRVQTVVLAYETGTGKSRRPRLSNVWTPNRMVEGTRVTGVNPWDGQASPLAETTTSRLDYYPARWKVVEHGSSLLRWNTIRRFRAQGGFLRACIARSAAWVRSATCSLVQMFDT
jgi:DNA-binding CsgD family transcriptional regulator